VIYGGVSWSFYRKFIKIIVRTNLHQRIGFRREKFAGQNFRTQICGTDAVNFQRVIDISAIRIIGPRDYFRDMKNIRRNERDGYIYVVVRSDGEQRVA
jgi:hypothetical protein